MTTRLMAAYGSNLCMEQMFLRCPDARPIGVSMLKGYRLWFRCVADIVKIKRAEVPIGIWQISERDELALDRYEGISSGLYRKETVKFGDGRTALIYVMNRKGIMPPTDGYLKTIRRGYQDFGLDETYLDAAVAHSWEKKNPTVNNWMMKKARLRREAQFA